MNICKQKFMRTEKCDEHCRCAEKSESALNDLLCPHCGGKPQNLITWWYDMKCPPSGILCKCTECGQGIEISPDTTFKIKAA